MGGEECMCLTRRLPRDSVCAGSASTVVSLSVRCVPLLPSSPFSCSVPAVAVVHLRGRALDGRTARPNAPASESAEQDGLDRGRAEPNARGLSAHKAECTHQNTTHTATDNASANAATPATATATTTATTTTAAHATDAGAVEYAAADDPDIRTTAAAAAALAATATTIPTAAAATTTTPRIATVSAVPTLPLHFLSPSSSPCISPLPLVMPRRYPQHARDEVAGHIPPSGSTAPPGVAQEAHAGGTLRCAGGVGVATTAAGRCSVEQCCGC